MWLAAHEPASPPIPSTHSWNLLNKVQAGRAVKRVKKNQCSLTHLGLVSLWISSSSSLVPTTPMPPSRARWSAASPETVRLNITRLRGNFGPTAARCKYRVTQTPNSVPCHRSLPRGLQHPRAPEPLWRDRSRLMMAEVEGMVGRILSCFRFCPQRWFWQNFSRPSRSPEAKSLWIKLLCGDDPWCVANTFRSAIFCQRDELAKRRSFVFSPVCVFFCQLRSSPFGVSKVPKKCFW